MTTIQDVRPPFPIWFLLLAVGLSTSPAWQSAQAQNFAPVGAKWHYSTGGFIGPQIGFFSFESVLDTIVDGQECRKLAGSTGCFDISEYVFDRNDSVFFYHTGREEFCLLYDFGATVGDTWTIYHSFGDSSVILVDSLGTLEVDGQMLRTVHTSSVHTGDIYFWGTFIERIGGSFPVIGFCDPSPGELRCYEDTVLSLHQGPYECEEIVISVNEAFNSQKQELSIYPNPASDVLHIQSKVPFARLRLLDISGRAVLSERIITDLHTLQLAGIPPGLYLLEATDTEGRSAVRKVVVQ